MHTLKKNSPLCLVFLKFEWHHFLHFLQLTRMQQKHLSKNNSAPLKVILNENQLRDKIKLPKPFWAVYSSPLNNVLYTHLTNSAPNRLSINYPKLFIVQTLSNTHIPWHNAKANPPFLHRDKICVYDDHPIAGRDIQYWAPESRSEYTTQFNVNNLLFTCALLTKNTTIPCE